MLIVVEDGGGLANRLFVSANVIVAGLATGHQVANPAFRRWAGSFVGGRYFFPFSTHVALMGALTATVAPRRATFLVCSDEDQDPSITGDIPVTVSTMGPVHDLWALSRCDLVMGPSSTFSAWAVFLGEVPLWEVDDPHCEPNLKNFLVPSPVPRVPAEAP